MSYMLPQTHGPRVLKDLSRTGLFAVCATLTLCHGLWVFPSTSTTWELPGVYSSIQQKLSKDGRRRR